VLAVVAPLKEGHKVLHDFGLLVGDLSFAVEFHMKVEKVNYHALDGVEHGIAVEMMVGQLQPMTDVLKVDGAYLLLFGPQMHDGVFKQGDVALHAVVALRSGLGDKLRYNVYYLYLKVGTLVQVADAEALLWDDQAVPRQYGVVCATEVKLAASFQAECMGDVPCLLQAGRVD
jgi:hypothetical protein